MKIILYSTHCPRCNILENKLKEKNITFEEVNDIEVMESKGIQAAPALEVDDKLMSYGEAVKFVNNYNA